MIELVTISIKLGVIAYVYSIVLTDAGMLLGNVYGWLSGIANRHPNSEWLLKPLMLCDRCVAGQFGLWGFVLGAWLKIHAVNVAIDIAFVISLTIVISQIIKKYLHD